MLACPTQASTRNGRASSVSPLRDLPGHLRTWLRARADARVQGAATSGAPARASTPELQRFIHIGEQLERRLEALKDIQWEIRENEVRYRDLPLNVLERLKTALQLLADVDE